MDKLGELRHELDEIDDQIAALYQRRMEISGEVGQFKVETN